VPNVSESAALSESSDSDRRRQTRQKVKLQRIFAAEILAQDGAQNCFLHIYDLSDSGMRVHTDYNFPPGQAIPMRLYLDKALELSVRVIWQKELVGGMQVVGLEFADLEEQIQNDLRAFLERHSPDNKRSSIRLQRILVVEMVLGSTRQKFGVFTLDISTAGMRISHDFPLPEDVDIPFRILLEYDLAAIDVVARVSWQEENTLGQYVIGLQFSEVDDLTRTRIEQFIERQIRGGVGSRAPMRQIADFDSP